MWLPKANICCLHHSPLHLILWDRVFRWTWSSLFQFDLLAKKQSIFLSLPLQPWDYRCIQPFLPFYVGSRDINSDHHAFMTVYPMNHLSISMNFISYMIPMTHKSLDFLIWCSGNLSKNCSQYMNNWHILQSYLLMPLILLFMVSTYCITVILYNFVIIINICLKADSSLISVICHYKTFAPKISPDNNNQKPYGVVG